MNLRKLQDCVAAAAATAASLLKVALLSRPPSAKEPARSRSLVIMGNGPSLSGTLELGKAMIDGNDKLAVNFAANTPVFSNVRPNLYVLADPHFFNAVQHDSNVGKLWKELGETDWDMQLWVPSSQRKRALTLLKGNSLVTVKCFNMTPLDGWRPLVHCLIDSGLGMPRPRNVLIPAIMVAIRSGYKRIFLTGADHTWTRTLGVDDENHVVSIQPHFYEESEEEKRRVRAAYRGLRLHMVLGSMATAFASYWKIADYAAEKGIEIINATPGSMIDAFPRMKKSD